MTDVLRVPQTRRPERLSPRLWRRSMLTSGVFLLLVCLAALLAPQLTRFSFDAQDLNRVLFSPNKINWFGTDGLGRDLFSRVLFGARVSLAIALATSILAVGVGVIYGSIAGYAGGWVDAVMMRTVDFLQSLPPLVLLILLSVISNSVHFGGDTQLHSVMAIVVALSLVGWVTTARLVRNQVLQVKEMIYVQAAQASGASMTEIIARHVFPNIAGPVVVMFSFLVPSQILHESFLSFLGLGVQPPYSSWGVLANEGWRSFRTYPHLILIPGAAIFFTMLACQFLGDGLRDLLDPQSGQGKRI